MGLELLHRLGGVVDQGEAGGLAATELSPETKDGNLVLLGLVHAGELVAELILGDVGAVRVEDVTAGGKSVQSALVFSCLSARNSTIPVSIHQLQAIFCDLFEPESRPRCIGIGSRC